jgi:hypothetical protein
MVLKVMGDIISRFESSSLSFELWRKGVSLPPYLALVQPSLLDRVRLHFKRDYNYPQVAFTLHFNTYTQ